MLYHNTHTLYHTVSCIGIEPPPQCTVVPGGRRAVRAPLPHTRCSATHLYTTVRFAGRPSSRTVASCTYLEYARLRFFPIERCSIVRH